MVSWKNFPPLWGEIYSRGQEKNNGKGSAKKCVCLEQFVLRIWIVCIFFLILYINREPETSMLKKWLFQSDDEPNLYMGNE